MPVTVLRILQVVLVMTNVRNHQLEQYLKYYLWKLHHYLFGHDISQRCRQVCNQSLLQLKGQCYKSLYRTAKLCFPQNIIIYAYSHQLKTRLGIAIPPLQLEHDFSTHLYLLPIARNSPATTSFITTRTCGTNLLIVVWWTRNWYVEL